MSAASRAVLCALLAAAMGCDGLGRAIVSEGSWKPEEALLCPPERPKCQPSTPVAPAATTAAPVERDLQPCSLDRPDEAELRDVELVSCELRGAELESLRELVHVQLRNVRIALGRGQALSVRDSELSSVAVVEAEVSEEAQGELHISHSRLWGAFISSNRVRLVSSRLVDCSIDTRELTGEDVQLSSSVVSTPSATLAAIELRESELRGCQAGVLIAAGALIKARVACQGKFQVYASGVDASSLDGEIETQNTTFEDSVFGVEHPTQIVGWGLGLHNSVLCEEVAGLRNSGGVASCNDCKGPMRDGDAAGETCEDPLKSTLRENNLCEAVQSMPRCDEYPEPRRPIGVQ